MPDALPVLFFEHDAPGSVGADSRAYAIVPNDLQAALDARQLHVHFPDAGRRLTMSVACWCSSSVSGLSNVSVPRGKLSVPSTTS